VAIRKLDIVAVTFLPHEADAQLIIDPDAELTLPVPLECLQPIAGWHAEVIKSLRVVQPLLSSVCSQRATVQGCTQATRRSGCGAERFSLHPFYNPFSLA
jgi:hypothetical protein